MITLKNFNIDTIPIFNIQSILTFTQLSPKEVKVKKSEKSLSPTLCDPMDYTVHGILQVRILEQVAFPFSRGSSQPFSRDQTQVSHIAGSFLTNWPIREVQLNPEGPLKIFNSVLINVLIVYLLVIFL